MRRTKARLLGRVGATRIYLATLQPSPLLRYLNLAALKRAKSLELQVGSVAIPGRTVPILAVITRGAVSELRPTDCPGCDEAGRSRPGDARRKALVRAVHERVVALDLHGSSLPTPITGLTNSAVGLIITVSTAPDGPICILIEREDGRACLLCTDHSVSCSRPHIPPIE